MNLSISTLDSSYIDALFQLDNQANATPWSKLNYQDSFNDSNHTVSGLFANNQLIGFCVISKFLDEAEVLQIVIAKSSQNNGYGNYLLGNICQQLELDGIQQIFLEVLASNSNAIHLYSKLQFNEIGIRKNYYTINGNKFDAILMARTNIINHQQ